MTVAAGENAAHSLDTTILREYDIRGIVGDTLTEDDAYAIGRAFGTEIARAEGGSVCVGYDGRLSSPEMERAVVDGIRACGLEAVRVGLGPTPMLYFSVNVLNAAGGIMVSGSHNPPEYNGFKMMRGPKPFYGADIENLARIASYRTILWSGALGTPFRRSSLLEAPSVCIPEFRRRTWRSTVSIPICSPCNRSAPRSPRRPTRVRDDRRPGVGGDEVVWE